MRTARVQLGPYVILSLKIAVAAVSALLAAALIALARGNVRLHGRINIVFFALTATALLVFEGLIRLYDPTMFDYLTPEAQQTLSVHLCFSIPSALLLPVMLFTGLNHYRTAHLALAAVFSLLWIGTFVTGIFFL
jgi:uncharacterized membrane protein YozB (DUF420 family)